jgi:hypothetical protein
MAEPDPAPLPETDTAAPLTARWSPARRAAVWLAGSIAGVALLVVLSVRSPERIKLLLWFPVAVGCLAGWGLGRLSRELGLGPSRGLTLASACLILFGQLGTALSTYHLRTTELQRQFAKEPLADFRDQLAKPPDDPKEKTAFEEMQRGLERSEEQRRQMLSFRGYLQHRVSLIGKWPSPWPEVLWGSELALATLAGTWLARRTARDLALPNEVHSIAASSTRLPPP